MNSVKVWLSVILLIIATSVSAQVLKPVKWSFAINRLSDTEAEVVATASIEGSGTCMQPISLREDQFPRHWCLRRMRLTSPLVSCYNHLSQSSSMTKTSIWSWRILPVLPS